METFKSPWLDFPLPADTISEEDMNSVRKSKDIKKWNQYYLIKMLRSVGDYYDLAPPLETDRFSREELGTLNSNPHGLTNPTFYQTNGVKVITTRLLDSVSSTTVDEESFFPPIRFSIETFLGNTNILDYVYNQSNQLQMMYWMWKSKLFDTPSFNVSSHVAETFKNNIPLSPETIEYFNLTSVTNLDIEMIDSIRKREMLHTEENFVNFIKGDRLGFFGGLGGISDPNWTNMLAHSAFATDNRRQFESTDPVDFIKKAGTRDYINYRFVIISAPNGDFVEVEWTFPQASHAARLTGMENFDNQTLISLYAKN